MKLFSTRGPSIIYPQGLLGYRKHSSIYIFLNQLNAIWFSTAFRIRSKTSLCHNTEHHRAVNLSCFAAAQSCILIASSC